MDEPRKRVWATIDTQALQKNLARVRALCPESKIIPVIKADAYGHGMEQIARAIIDSHTAIAAFAVATMAEALALHSLKLDIPILLLPGFAEEQELGLCIDAGVEMVVHSPYQLSILQDRFESDIPSGVPRLWLKLNSGMNRLGFSAAECVKAYHTLRRFPEVELVLMSHLGCADDSLSAIAGEFTSKQIAEFNRVRDQLVQESGRAVVCSMAASAGILGLPETHYDYVRPGVMLYGASPLADETGEELGLLPVMTLHSRLIAINEVAAGDSIGYGATYVCDRQTRVGVIAIGYADGYPRSATNGTAVLIKTPTGLLRTRLIGRASMDMITVELTGMDDVQVGDEVVLWGVGLCADEVARQAGTISYELFCKLTERVDFEYA
ncbi:MAG TPA: alanine racemase [Gammaproteobacteria bacterium]|jgi:alanine racemase|nr:alanine racemase [Gammaproteobacteria bacterium]HIL63588.1 alanine racemase [Porticoccaceae bacterium]